jgi:hypothetical protein
MSSKKTTSTSPGDANVPALQIGSRVRCTDDGALGRIAWANATSVKIKWDDSEQVAWRRDSLAGRPIEFLDADPAAEANRPEPTATEPAPEQAAVEQAAPADLPAAQATAPAEQATAVEVPATEPATAAPEPTEVTPPVAGDSVREPAPAAPAKPTRQRKAPAEPKEKKLSAIDAAACVLAEAGTAMSCQEMIQAMAAKGYWTSPAGRTPAATLYSSILREVTVKGAAARFRKAERGKFARTPVA